HQRRADEGNAGVEGGLREGARGERLCPDHDRDCSAEGLLLRRGLSSAVPCEESRRLLRPRRHRRRLSNWDGCHGLTAGYPFLTIKAANPGLSLNLRAGPERFGARLSFVAAGCSAECAVYGGVHANARARR